MLPDEQVARDFCEPIVRKVEAKHEAERFLPPPPPRKQRPWGKRPGDGTLVTGMHHHLTGQARRRGVNLEDRNDDVLGELSLFTPGPRKKKKRNKFQRQIVAWFRWLMTMPEWKARIIATLCSDDPPEKKKDAWMRIYADSERLFGDPLKERPKRIQVG